MAYEIDTGTPSVPTATAPAEAAPSDEELGLLFNLIMANATSLYQEAFSQTQEAMQDDEEE